MAGLFRPVLAMAAGGLLLTGCGGSGPVFAPKCPRPSILGEAGDLVRYRGTGRDFLDTTLQGRITGISGDCKPDGSRTVVTTVSVALEVTRGPAATSRRAEVPFFIAVSRGNQVLDKQVYTLQVEFPENTDRVRLSGDSVELRLPVSKDHGADEYQVTTGFQLTPAELESNRRH